MKRHSRRIVPRGPRKSAVWHAPLLRDHVPLGLQGLLQALCLQQQLVHGHVMLLPLLLQLLLGHLQGLRLAAQPDTEKSARPVSTPALKRPRVSTHADATAYFSSDTLRSRSLFSRQLCLSFSSPSRDVAWAFRASQSLASCGNGKRWTSLGLQVMFAWSWLSLVDRGGGTGRSSYLDTVLVLLFEHSFGFVPLS